MCTGIPNDCNEYVADEYNTMDIGVKDEEHHAIDDDDCNGYVENEYNILIWT